MATVIAFPVIHSGGPGSGRHPGFGRVVPITNKSGNAIVTARQKIALRAAKPAGKFEQRLGEKGELTVRNSLKAAVQAANNSPFDVLTRDGKHAIEVKTLTPLGKNDKITMKREAMERKYKYGNDHGLRIHTIVVDMRDGKRVAGFYYKEGVGSFRLGSMQHITKPEALERAMRSRQK